MRVTGTVCLIWNELGRRVGRKVAVLAARNIQPLILLEFFNDFCSSEQDHLLDRDASEVPENYEGERNYGGCNNTT